MKIFYDDLRRYTEKKIITEWNLRVGQKKYFLSLRFHLDSKTKKKNYFTNATEYHDYLVVESRQEKNFFSTFTSISLRKCMYFILLYKHLCCSYMLKCSFSYISYLWDRNIQMELFLFYRINEVEVLLSFYTFAYSWPDRDVQNMRNARKKIIYTYKKNKWVVY